MRNKGTIEVDVTYPWTGQFIDDTIEGTLGAKAHSSGCGCGERDMQFTLPDTPDTLAKLEAIRRQPGVKATVR